MHENKSGRELADEGTRLLRQAGFTWSGAKKGTKDHRQSSFERRMVKTGFRGASRPGK